MSDAIPNVLAERYASSSMCAIWSGEGKVRLERELWIAVMKAQRDLGILVPDGVIESYERVKDQVNLDSIMQRERVTRHDVKARIEEFCDLAGHEHIHKGMTSRDLTENVEQLQVFRSLQVVQRKSVAALVKLAARAKETRDIPLTLAPITLPPRSPRWASASPCSVRRCSVPTISFRACWAATPPAA
nr:hypothetical protein [Verrucomicrobium spinosum]